MNHSSSKIALVTGGSRGIGVGICQSLIEHGYRVAIGYNQTQPNQEAFNSTVAEHVTTVQIDIGSLSSVEHAFEQVRKHFGEIDVLVNNAGIAQEKPFLTISDEDWQHMLNINLMGAVRCSKEAIPAMKHKGFGRIINISSIGGQWGGFNQVHYAAAKAALINFTRSMAKIYSKEGITTNAIAPGLVATEMSENELDTEAGKEKVRTIPAGRLGTTDEVGELVTYLASEQAGYITGQTINFNGGMYFD